MNKIIFKLSMMFLCMIGSFAAMDGAAKSDRTTKSDSKDVVVYVRDEVVSNILEKLTKWTTITYGIFSEGPKDDKGRFLRGPGPREAKTLDDLNNSWPVFLSIFDPVYVTDSKAETLERITESKTLYDAYRATLVLLQKEKKNTLEMLFKVIDELLRIKKLFRGLMAPDVEGVNRGTSFKTFYKKGYGVEGVSIASSTGESPKDPLSIFACALLSPEAIKSFLNISDLTLEIDKKRKEKAQKVAAVLNNIFFNIEIDQSSDVKSSVTTATCSDISMGSAGTVDAPGVTQRKRSWRVPRKIVFGLWVLVNLGFRAYDRWNGQQIDFVSQDFAVGTVVCGSALSGLLSLVGI